MSSFKKTYTRNFAKANPASSADAQYWKHYEFPITVKEFSYIDYIDINPVEPYYIAVTSGPKIDIYHQQTAQIWRSLTRFQRNAYGGKFRRDGQLLISGSEEAQVKLFNFRQKQLLRVFKGHTGPVHRVDFIHNKPEAVSFSDDKTLSLWDISDEKEIINFADHTDFVRAGVASTTSEHIIFSGSYDHTIKTWDSRTGSCVTTFNHGAPVESVICYPSGSIIASAGGTEVKIWDAVGGRLLSVLSQHHKPITCLGLATKDTRLLSGSLDRHVKVYDLKTYSVVHSIDYSSPVLSLAVAPGDSTLAVGMLSDNSGLISFQQRSTKKDHLDVAAKTDKKKKNFKVMAGDEVITHVEREKISHYDRMLKKFEFTRALDDVLQAGVANKMPNVTIAILRELIRRGGLATALAGREAKSLNPIFRFLTKNIRNPNFNPILIQVSNTILDIYGSTVGENPKIVNQLTRLNEELENDILVSKSGVSLLGVIEMFLSVSTNVVDDEFPRDNIFSSTQNRSLDHRLSSDVDPISTKPENLDLVNKQMVVDIS